MWKWVAVTAVAIGAAWGQEPRFEVVSVKPCPTAPVRGQGTMDGSPGRLHVECMTVSGMISYSFVQYADGKPWPANPKTGRLTPPFTQAQLMQELKGAPAWMKSERFTIDAKAAGPESIAMMRGPMMQAVLRDRFLLKLHRETREVPVFDLTVDKGGAKLTPMKDGSCIALVEGRMPPMKREPGQAPPTICGGFVAANRGIDVHGAQISDLCVRFGATLDRDIIDKTGLPGEFDIHLELTFPDIVMARGAARMADGAEASDPAGTIVSALRKLGLRLEPSKAKMDFLVIDSVERPAAN